MTAREPVRVKRILIEKFRAINKAEILFGEVVALVGQNGAGKSTVLRALNAFFNYKSEQLAFESGSHRYSTATTSIIEVSIEGLDGTGLPTSGPRLEFRARLRFRNKPIWQVWREGGWHADATLPEVLSKHLSFALIPTRRDYTVANDPTSGLLERAVEDWVTRNSQRDRRSPEIQRVATRLRQRSLSGLERKLRSVAPLDGPFNFELSYAVPPDYRLLLQNLTLTVREGGQEIALSDSGSGTQSMAAFALYAHLAEIQTKTYLLGFEEPEQNLHPQAQQQLIRNLRSLGLQVVFTTHSPTVVDMLAHTEVVLCKRSSSSRRSLEVALTQIHEDFFTHHGLDEDKYYKFHRRKNSEFLFADFVVVTESPIDAAVLDRLLTEAGCPPDTLGISIVSADGVSKENIPYMYHLLKDLGIEAAFVVDRDYFLQYSDTEKDASRDARGFPKYAPIARPGCLLPEIFKNHAERDQLILDLAHRPSKVMPKLAGAGFFCFMWELEVDLVNAVTTRERMFDILAIPAADRSENSLLIKRRKRIKDQGVLLETIGGLGPTALPTSYRTLRREIPVLARRARSRG